MKLLKYINFSLFFTLLACHAQIEGKNISEDGVPSKETATVATEFDTFPILAGMETLPLPGQLEGDPLMAPETLERDFGKDVDESHFKSIERVDYFASKSQRGQIIPILESTIVSLCGDFDGCTLRMGMNDWDNTGRTASRSNLFYYNPVNRMWRAEKGDTSGTDYNGVTEHVMKAWSCYLTDGYFENWTHFYDGSVGFGLLSWNQYNANCHLTIID